MIAFVGGVELKRKDVISFVTHNSCLEILKCALFKKKNSQKHFN